MYTGRIQPACEAGCPDFKKTMPLQNRVTPTGEIVFSQSRGLFMGNRGRLHNEAKQIVRSSQHKHWVTCALEFKGVRRALMSDDSYTELFFLDEATALAAGHRPCWDCRKPQYRTFTRLWASTFQVEKFNRDMMDNALHAERRSGNDPQNTHYAAVEALPNGSCVEFGGNWYVIWGAKLLEWSFEGYLAEVARPKGIEVQVLTPPSIVAVLQAGYEPELHPTAARYLTEEASSTR
ncbi:hypothetical protein AWB77_00250 [Caballeronia fortuita]|uniref:Uncharacterized protein n=2 Tax=Caballeronia fortuita TaxID=1777138 RepID=A0A157Z4X9_9BURK|nr:hypothetical protein AWB77_00250 [Caballeronia fortuita]